MIFSTCTTCEGHGELYRRIGPCEWDTNHGVKCWTCKGEGKVPRSCDNCNEPATHAVKENIEESGLVLCDDCANQLPHFLNREQHEINRFLEQIAEGFKP